jgi:N-acetylglucosaminyldiphosphoundecaprenol N-acetyl-beta-D-mannosaminyltransferase
MIKCERITILGVGIDNVDTSSALDIIEGFIRERKPHMVVTADSSGIVLADTDHELREIMNSADLVTPDSFGVLWASRRQGTPLQERVSGIDVVKLLCARGSEHEYSVFLLGAAPGVAETAADNLKHRCPGLRIAGTYHGYFSEEESGSVIEQIRESKPDILFVALGIPRQEKWIALHMKELDVPVAMGVGGSFDVISGNVRRAPKWMQDHGLEWLFRLYSDPRKIRKVLQLPRFVLMILHAGRSGNGRRS